MDMSATVDKRKFLKIIGDCVSADVLSNGDVKKICTICFSALNRKLDGVPGGEDKCSE